MSHDELVDCATNCVTDYGLCSVEEMNELLDLLKSHRFRSIAFDDDDHDTNGGSDLSPFFFNNLEKDLELQEQLLTDEQSMLVDNHNNHNDNNSNNNITTTTTTTKDGAAAVETAEPVAYLDGLAASNDLLRVQEELESLLRRITTTQVYLMTLNRPPHPRFPPTSTAQAYLELCHRSNAVAIGITHSFLEQLANKRSQYQQQQQQVLLLLQGSRPVRPSSTDDASSFVVTPADHQRTTNLVWQPHKRAHSSNTSFSTGGATSSSSSSSSHESMDPILVHTVPFALATGFLMGTLIMPHP